MLTRTCNGSPIIFPYFPSQLPPPPYDSFSFSFFLLIKAITKFESVTKQERRSNSHSSTLMTMDSETVNVSSADQIGNSKTAHRQFNMQQTSAVRGIMFN